LLIEDRQPFSLHLGFDSWQEIDTRESTLLPFGIWAVRIAAEDLSRYMQLNFTRRVAGAWEYVDHRVLIDYAPVKHWLAS